MSLFIPITKVDVAQRMVYGTLSEEVPDKDGEILDYESAKPAFQEWSDQFREASGGKSLGNVRAMHRGVAAGKLTDIVFNDAQKRIEGAAKIVDEEEWRKVLEGLYTGFSIGGGYARRWPDKEQPQLMRYTPILSEVSLVDNPAVPTATFEVVKQDGSVELRKFTLPADSKKTVAYDAADEPDDVHMLRLCQDLEWLEETIREEDDDADADILECICTLLEYLSHEEAMDGEPENAADDDAFDDETEDMSAHEYAGELARLSRRGEMRKSVHFDADQGLQSQIQALQKRVRELEAEPAPAKGVLRAVNKSDDHAFPTGALHHPDLARLSAAERARELMKMALAQPMAV